VGPFKSEFFEGSTGCLDCHSLNDLATQPTSLPLEPRIIAPALNLSVVVSKMVSYMSGLKSQICSLLYITCLISLHSFLSTSEGTGFLVGASRISVSFFQRAGSSGMSGESVYGYREEGNLRHVSTTSTEASTKCPYTATKAFISRQAAFISKAFIPGVSSGQEISSRDINNHHSRYVNGIPSANPLMTRETLFTNQMNTLLSDSKRIYETKLYSTTIESPTSTAVLDDDANKKNIGGVVEVSEKKPNEKKAKKEKKKKQQGSSKPLEIIVLGLSHHNAKVDVREKVAIPEEDWNSAANDLCAYSTICEAAPLSTCNRFEMYIAGENQYSAMRDAMDYLEKRSGFQLDQETLRQNIFILTGEDAIWHILRVSAGLDSLVVGEGQILAQVKKCYEHGIEEDGQAGKVIARMLNTAITAGKRVRSETGISKGAVSISSAAAEFTNWKIHEDLGINGIEDAKICILGAGKMARLLLVHLQTQGVKKVHIVNRSPDRVVALREEFPDLEIELSLMDKMWDVITDSDVVYPATYSSTTLIDPPELTEAISKRTKTNGIQFVDISVPRNVHADCENVEGVFSYNVDHLKAVVEKNTAMRRKEMVEAEIILREEMGKYIVWQQSLGAIPTIAKLQEKAEKLRQEELKKASNKLANLSPKDLEAVERLSKGIVNKLLHGPMNHLRQQKNADDTRLSIRQVQEAFQLDLEAMEDPANGI